MKWFTAANYASLQNDQFFQLLQAAVRSAKHNTTLTPCLLYDGQDCPQLDWLDQHGVSILRSDLTIAREIQDYLHAQALHHLIPKRLGSWLRLELCPTLRRFGYTDRYILYTDCDVVFLREVWLEWCKPRTLAAVVRRLGGYTRFHILGTRHFNAGVLVLNVDAMVKSYDKFRSFILSNGNGVRRPNQPYPFIQKHLLLSDQVALNLFYGPGATPLPRRYNWNPSEGINPDAVIVHFNGLKWNEWRDFVNGTLPERYKSAFTPLVMRNKDAYRYYCEVAQRYDCGEDPKQARPDQAP